MRNRFSNFKFPNGLQKPEWVLFAESCHHQVQAILAFKADCCATAVVAIPFNGSRSEVCTITAILIERGYKAKVIHPEEQESSSRLEGKHDFYISTLHSVRTGLSIQRRGAGLICLTPVSDTEKEQLTWRVRNEGSSYINNQYQMKNGVKV